MALLADLAGGKEEMLKFYGSPKMAGSVLATAFLSMPGYRGSPRRRSQARGGRHAARAAGATQVLDGPAGRLRRLRAALPLLHCDPAAGTPPVGTTSAVRRWRD